MDAREPSFPASFPVNSPVELLQELIRFDTSNPPGETAECIEWIEALLGEAGFETSILATNPDAPNLIARAAGDAEAPPLLLYGHVDVVPAEPAEWRHPPFDGVLDDGFVWGRGALDMKGGLSMLLSAALWAGLSDAQRFSDLVMMVVSDEEAGSDDGLAYLVDEHPEALDGIDYAIGEFGGFPMEIEGERFYPIQIDEKRVCWSKLTFSGEGGHGSLPHSGTAMADLGRTITAIDGARLPVHVDPTVERMIEIMAGEFSGERREKYLGLSDPARTDEILDELPDERATLDAMLHNTVNPTVVSGGSEPNTVPSTVEVRLDCRLLPGQGVEDLQRELRQVIPEDIDYDFEVIRFEQFESPQDLDLFDLLARNIENAVEGATAFPFLSWGGTDARHLSKIGIQSYGYTPMVLPSEMDFFEYIHAPDEKIPEEAVRFGANRLFEVVGDYPDER